MTNASNGSPQFFVGWDVGGWNCERNSKSRDAIVVLNRSGDTLGNPWRGNLRSTINGNAGAKEFLSALLSLCNPDYDGPILRATIAIDAPLAFPAALVGLITRRETLDHLGNRSAENRYLFRFTERQLASENTVSPLSPIKDMIGSQSTKAMHLISRLNLQQIETGVWSDDSSLTIIETYPSLCRKRLNQDRDSELRPAEADIRDARICAQIAHDFHFRRESLEFPPPAAPKDEGWIWAPKRK